LRANRAYHLIASREGGALLAADSRLDRVEVVSVDDGEVVFFWELPHRSARRLLRELRSDLVDLEAAEFFDKWAGADVALED